ARTARLPSSTTPRSRRSPSNCRGRRRPAAAEGDRSPLRASGGTTMSMTCTVPEHQAETDRANHLLMPVPAPVDSLREVVRLHGTPTYAYDLGRIRAQIASLKAALPPAVEILYSLKANASLGLCGFIAAQGLGADVASAGELVTALDAGFRPERLLVSGPDKS